ncbi:hypothetical protein DFH06DRAFT_157234 [Mycena polygramma]|nr:hypothetical protein DFH06DRAFT_157234 [Mycena polygramma]
MRIHGVLWALSLALVSLAYDGDGDSPHDIDDSSTRSLTSPSPSQSIEDPFHTPSFTSGFITPIGTPTFPSSSTFVAATSFIGTAPSASSSASAAAVAAVIVRKGPIVAAAVGGSIASTLIVLAGALFFLRHSGRPAPVPAEAASDVLRRCEALEREVAGLREQVARIEARGVGGDAPALYSNEKDGEALDGKVAKDHPPTYVD